MSRINRYRRGKIAHYISIAMLSLLLILVFYKVGHIIKKVTLVDQALSFYEDKEWTKAEETLQQANTYNWFEYKKEVTNNYLEELSWITEFNPLMQELSIGLEKNEATQDYDAFTQLWKAYQTSHFSALSEDKKTYLLSYYPVDTQIDKGWTNYKSLMDNLLNRPTSNVNYNWAKKVIFEVPDKYFEEDKQSTITNLFISCDNQLVDQAINKFAKEEGYLTFKELLNTINDIYEINAEVSYQSKWITDKIKPYIETILEAKSTQDTIQVFERYIETYRQTANRFYKDEEIENLVENFTKEQEVKATTLIENQSYEEGIALYEAMNYFKNYKEEIEIANKMKKYDHEELLLSKKEEEYSFMTKGSNALGAFKYILGVNADKGTLEVVTLDGTRKDYVATTYEITLSSKIPEDIQVIDELLLLTSEGSNRTHHYELIIFKEGTFNTVLEIEANNLEVLEGGNKLKINSPEGGYEGYEYTYIYTESGYTADEIVSTPISLGDEEVTNYVGRIVSLECYVPEEAAGSTALGMFIKDNMYDPERAAELYYEDGRRITVGIYTIIGEYVENVLYTYGEIGEQRIIPRIKILEIN